MVVELRNGAMGSEEGRKGGLPGKKRAVFGGERVVLDFHLLERKLRFGLEGLGAAARCV